MAVQKESITVARPRLPHWFVVFFVPISLTLLFLIQAVLDEWVYLFLVFVVLWAVMSYVVLVERIADEANGNEDCSDWRKSHGGMRGHKAHAASSMRAGACERSCFYLVSDRSSRHGQQVSYFNPSILPYQHLGLFGDFMRYIVKQQTFLFCLVAFTCFTHTTESLYCLILTRRYNLNLLDTISWFILVFVYGFFCLQYLKPIKEKST